MTVKHHARELIGRLPEDCTWLDAEREMILAHLRSRIQESYAPDAVWVDHEDVRKQMKQWLAE